MRASCASTPPRRKAMPGVLGVFTGADVRADGLKPIPHSAVPSTKFDMKLGAAGRPRLFIGPHMLLPADKTRHVGEARGDGGGGDARAGDGRRRGGRDRVPGAAVRRCIPRTRSSPARRRSWDEVADNVLIDTTVRRQGRDRPRLRAGRPCGEDGVQRRPRHRGDDGAALRARPVRRRPRGATRSTPAAAAR